MVPIIIALSVISLLVGVLVPSPVRGLSASLSSCLFFLILFILSVIDIYDNCYKFVKGSWPRLYVYYSVLYFWF
jgi:hypothetical protein